MSLRFLSLLLATLACGLALPAHAADEVSFAAGLRTRGLYRLADIYCRQQLDAGRLTDRQQAEMAIELSRVHHQRGMELAAGERAAAWTEAERALDGYREASGTQNYTLLVDLQEALNLLEQAELERLEQLDLSEGPPVEALRTKLRAVVSELREVETEVASRRRALAPGRATGDEAFTTSELDGLDRHIALALAEALREQGLSYPARSADRDDALLQSTTALRTLANDRVTDTITWRARVALLEAMALLKQTEEGLPLWQAWSSQTPPAEIGPKLLAGGVRLLIAARATDQAARQLQSAPWPAGSSAELDFVRLELALDQVEREGAGTGRLEPLLAVLCEAHPPQWIRRGESLVGRTLAARGDTASGLALKHAAEHYYRAGEYDAAVDAYDRLAEQSRTAGDRQEAFAAERSAAAILQSQGDHQQAAARFRRLALASLDQRESAFAHREALLSLATIARRADRDARAAKLADYIEACREHLRHWADGPTSDEVRLWFGRLLIERGQWPVAIETLGPVSPASPHTAPAMALLAEAYRRHAETMADPQQLATTINQATVRLQPTIVDGGWPAEWSTAQRTTALELARLHLLRGREGAKYAEDMLTAALLGAPGPSQEWQAQAIPVLAMALVQGGKTREGVEWLRRSAGDAESLEALVDGLVASLRQLPADDPQRGPLGQLILAAIDTAGQRASEWQTPVDRYRAAGLAATGDMTQGRALYERLASEFPKDGDLAEEFAMLLAASPQRDDRVQALTRWQQLESGSQRGGPRWFRARLARVKLLTSLGQTAEAEKLVKLTRLLYPDLGGAELARQFEALSPAVARE